jgi:hypothetical protein
LSLKARAGQQWSQGTGGGGSSLGSGASAGAAGAHARAAGGEAAALAALCAPATDFEAQV